MFRQNGELLEHIPDKLIQICLSISVPCQIFLVLYILVQIFFILIWIINIIYVVFFCTIILLAILNLVYTPKQIYDQIKQLLPFNYNELLIQLLKSTYSWVKFALESLGQNLTDAF